MAQAYSIESAIHQQLAQIGSCSLDELAACCPVIPGPSLCRRGRLTREGSVTLQHSAPFHYLLSLAPRRSVEEGLVMSS